ncbi:MAG: class I SAM-dependent methyltransferase [Candidatus Dormibacteria bacterium]
MSSVIVGSELPLTERYASDAVQVFDADERARFLDEAGVARHHGQLAWELLYRIEPSLYVRLVAGERLHEGILGWLPERCERILEVGAGAGRLTLELARRSAHLTAVEPAAPLRQILAERLHEAGAGHARAVRGFFDDLPVPAHSHDLVISCAAFTRDGLVDPDRCLAEMESRCARGGMVVLVWPSEVAWLDSHGFDHIAFAGPMTVEYQSVEEAMLLARIFYPDALASIVRGGSRFVDYATLGLNAPRDVCWKRCR